MINKTRFREILADYKRDFSEGWWDNEKYKWQAVKIFQDNWNINAENFADMLSNSLDGADNLLVSANNFPKKMILGFAKASPEEVRSMFAELYNENKNVYERIEKFKDKSADLLEKYGNGAAQHYQNENTVSIYLWLRFPKKYYIYKYREIKTAARELDPERIIKKGAYSDNIKNAFELYDEMRAEIMNDHELVNLLREKIDENCYPDPEFRTLTQDVGFYISRGTADTPERESEQEPEDFFEEDTSGYSKKFFLEDVYMSEEKYNALAGVLRYKKNIILQGAPGVGKTFAARRLAWSMMGEKNNERIEFVQFHQSYSYDDFVMGYKPSGEGFELREGVFYRFCKKAEGCPEKEFFFIIDEINRGNLSKIFGELLVLIEKDYRGAEITTAYSDEKFSVPKNLYIIGMMNTADRSLAMIDYALRRRFSFFEMEPGFNSEGFSRYIKKLENENLNELINLIIKLNNEIAEDPSLGKGFRIGHSYFCGQKNCTVEWLRSVIDYDIIPTLEEYWFDELEKINYWKNILRGVLQ